MIKREDTQAVTNKEGFPLTEEANHVPTSALPTLPIGDCQYVLLTDIQALFDIREDYYLAIITQNLEEDHGFVEGMDKYLLLDSNVKATSEFLMPT